VIGIVVASGDVDIDDQTLSRRQRSVVQVHVAVAVNVDDHD